MNNYNCLNTNLLQNQMLCYCLNIKHNPVRDYRSSENKCHKTSHAVRYATCMLQYGYIPYGMQSRDALQCVYKSETHCNASLQHS